MPPPDAPPTAAPAHRDVTPLDLTQLDRDVARALAAVDASASSQLAALAALRTLHAALPADGVLIGHVARLLQEKQAAFVAFHERRLAAERDNPHVRQEAEAFAVGVGGHASDIANVTALAAKAPPPKPFFARFLEHQRR